MTRTAFTSILAGTILALSAGIASAHGSFAFDDAYWKAPVERTSAQQTGARQTSKYDLVDNYNY